MDLGKIERGVKLILQGLNCDVNDRNFLLTPERIAKMYNEIFNCPDVEYPTFEEQYNNFILLRGHEMYAFCPHHLLPVELSIDVAYIPNGEVLGLSKLARLLHDINRGPILQEKFTHDIIDKIYEVLPSCKGAACVVTGKHGCAKIRGVHTKGDFRTYSIRGEFQSDPDQERRFLELARNGK